MCAVRRQLQEIIASILMSLIAIKALGRIMLLPAVRKLLTASLDAVMACKELDAAARQAKLLAKQSLEYLAMMQAANL